MKKDLDNPIEVTITACFFNDVHHDKVGSGTEKYKSTSAWEIHPVTDIKLTNATE